MFTGQFVEQTPMANYHPITEPSASSHLSCSSTSSSSSSIVNNGNYISATMTSNPIDLNEQEKIKLERKRLRNRMAASRCRKKKLERISQLEDRVGQLRGENKDLNDCVGQLREKVGKLQRELIGHIEHGCPINELDANCDIEHFNSIHSRNL